MILLQTYSEEKKEKKNGNGAKLLLTNDSLIYKRCIEDAYKDFWNDIFF